MASDRLITSRMIARSSRGVDDHSGGSCQKPARGPLGPCWRSLAAPVGRIHTLDMRAAPLLGDPTGLVPVFALSLIFPRAFAAARCSRKASSPRPARTPATSGRSRPASCAASARRAPGPQSVAALQERAHGVRLLLADAGDVPARVALRGSRGARAARTTLAALACRGPRASPPRGRPRRWLLRVASTRDHRRQVEQTRALDQPDDVADQARAQADLRAAVGHDAQARGALAERAPAAEDLEQHVVADVDREDRGRGDDRAASSPPSATRGEDQRSATATPDQQSRSAAP